MNSSYHYTMDSTDSRTGEHCDRQFKYHRHVYCHSVALRDALRLQYISKSANLLEKFSVCESRVIFRIVAFPETHETQLINRTLERTDLLPETLLTVKTNRL